MQNSERIVDRERDQIEYLDEDPMIRTTFTEELSKRNLTSLLPAEPYQDKTFQWQYSQG